MALTEGEHAEGYALACQARCTGDVVIEPAAKGIEFAPSFSTTATVRSVQPLTPDINRLVLQLPADVELGYRPGQYMNIVLPDGLTRSFSMASARLPDRQVDFHVRRIPGGRFTEQMIAGLEPGDPLELEIPLGTFCFHEADWRPMILAATGTGLAPIKAILESLLDNDDCPPVTLYWGMRTEADLYLKEEIESWAERLCEFVFVPVLSRAGERWPGRRGHVQDAILEDYADLSEHAVYLCGAPEMIAQAKQRLPAHGALLAYIYSDSFTFQHAPALAA
jgi:CDP-4-dehydro-6-deoxyglucose reductase